MNADITPANKITKYLALIIDDCIQMLHVGNVKMDVVIDGRAGMADGNFLCPQNLRYIYIFLTSNRYSPAMMPIFQSNVACGWGNIPSWVRDFYLLKHHG